VGALLAEAGAFEVTGKNVVAMQAMVAKNPADDQRRDERLHLSAERRYADIEADSHARGAERRSRDDQAGARRVIRRRVHPGVCNVTGMDELPPGITATRLTLLKTIARLYPAAWDSKRLHAA